MILFRFANLSIAKSLLAAYDSGELSGALTEGQPRWKNWAKNFGIETLDLIVWCSVSLNVYSK